MSEPYAFTEPMVAQARGITVTNALQQQQRDADRQVTLRTAGNALATGDVNGGAGTLYRSGDLQGGLQFANIAQAKTDATTAAATKAKEDADEAEATAWSDTATRLSQFHQSVSSEPGANPALAMQRTLGLYDQMVPKLKDAGVDDEDIAQARARLQQDPQATLAALGAGAAKQLGYDVRVVDGQIVAVDKATGKARLIASAGGGGQAPAPQAAPTPTEGIAPTSGPASADAVWKSIKHQESGGEASPGTAVGPDTPYGNALGSTQMLPATAEAMARKLGIAWNPALMRENSPKALAYQDQLGRAYFEEGVQKAGGDLSQGAAYYFGGPDPKLHGPKTRAYVQAVMARAGQGGAPATPDLAGAGSDTLAGGAGADALAPGSVSADGVLQLAPHQQEWVSDGHGGQKNLKTGKVEKDPSYVGQAVDADPKLVQMLIDGRAPMPAPSKRTDPAWLAALDAAAQQDPTFDAGNYATRVKTRQSFLSGKDHQNVVAINTLVGHLDRLDHHIDNLNNAGGFPGSHLINAGKQWFQEQSGTAEGYRQFEADKEAVVTEATKVFRGASGAEADVKRNLDNLKTANSPGELHSAVREIAHLMNSRLESVADSYKQGMGKSSDPMDFLYPAQKDAFSRIMSGAKPAAPASSSHGAAAPSGVDPKLWAHMTPQERALWTH